ncbi:hypothetical protein ACWDRR_20425 [Kitasatospora sp. NPDC003701]
MTVENRAGSLLVGSTSAFADSRSSEVVTNTAVASSGKVPLGSESRTWMPSDSSSRR